MSSTIGSRTIKEFFRRGMPAAFFFLIFGATAFMLAGSVVGAQQTPPAKPRAAQTPDGKAFASPEEAAEALHAAARKNDEASLLVIFGPSAKEIVVWGDNPQDRQDERADFAQKYEQMHRLVTEPDGAIELYLGAENWPLPIPLVKVNGSWYFDAGSGKQEVMFRRIGKNEFEALEVCHALVDAEKDYHATAHAYALKFVSGSGAHDGLYWTGTGAASPIGPYLAHAGLDSSDGNRTPFHGYYYRILPAERGGFAILAFPAEYRSSGVVTFLMDQKGNAYEKDLGAKTDSVARQMNSSDPNNTWKKTE